MKPDSTSSRSLFLALGLLVLTSCSEAEAVGDHGHGPGSDHSHNDDAHDHDHAHDGHHHDHATAGEPVLGFVLTDTPVAGEPFTFDLILSDGEGRPVTTDDLMVVHDHKLHVLVVDEALEDYTHTHPKPGPDGLYRVIFTPEFARTYRVWADYRLAEAGDHDHEHDDHSHDEHDHHDHHAEGSVPIAVSEALIVGEEAGPDLSGDDVLTATAGGLTYTLLTDGALTTGGSERLIIKVTGPDGAPFEALEPIMGAYAHLVGFNRGATEMVHAHPEGDHPHGAASRGGPDLEFEVTFMEPGPYRLFLQTMVNGNEQTVSFTPSIEP